jgi:predicted MFS family arabinose efflux permease
MAFLAMGGFMLMPFGSAFSVNNMHITLHQLPLVYMVTGICSIVAGPLLGRLSDAVGKYQVFTGGTLLATLVVLFYTRLGPTPLWEAIALNSLLFVGITARIISVSALISAVPDLPDRGAFMSVNSSLQQFSGGIASWLAGLIVVQTQSGLIERYDVLGIVVAASMILTIALMYPIHRKIKEKTQPLPMAA